MVSQSSYRRKAINKRYFTIFASIIIIGALAGTCYLLVLFKSRINSQIRTPEIPESTEITEVVSEESTAPQIQPINFQPVIDKWVSSIGGNKSVLIYDLNLDASAGEYNTKEDYNTASLYKLFVVYEGYRRIESGAWDANALAGSTGHTIIECLDLAIRESNSPCGETLWQIIGQKELDQTIATDFKIADSKISSLVSNAEDIAKIMRLYYSHAFTNSPELVSRIKDSFLNQPTTTYNWRQGLPSGFLKAEVYNKVGWEYDPDNKNWKIYHDAAIVHFDDGRDFVVVVMTNFIDYKDIARLGNMIEEYYYQ